MEEGSVIKHNTRNNYFINQHFLYSSKKCLSKFGIATCINEKIRKQSVKVSPKHFMKLPPFLDLDNFFQNPINTRFNYAERTCTVDFLKLMVSEKQ